MKKLILSATVIIATSCSVTLAPDSKFAKMAMSQHANETKVLFESKCAKCHDLPSASSFSEEEWKAIMLRMQPKAKLSDEQREAIYAYLVLK
jgi:hypothetical protein